MKHKLGPEASRNWHAVVQYAEENLCKPNSEGTGEIATNGESPEAAQIQNGSGINESPSSIFMKEAPKEEKTEPAAAVHAEVEVKEESKDETKEEESVGSSSAEPSELEQLKKDIIE